MAETPELAPHLKALVSLPEKHGLPHDFSLMQMRDLSVREVGEMESYLNALPSNHGIKTTLKAIESARLAGIGPFEGTLPPLAIPNKVEVLIRNARFLDEIQFPTPQRIAALKALTPEEGTILQEALTRLKHEQLALGDPFRAEGIDNFLQTAKTHAATKLPATPAVVETLKSGGASGYYSGSSAASSTVAKGEESWIGRLSKEKWVGKKGLVVAGATVGVGAVMYGAKKLLGRDKAPENQHER